MAEERVEPREINWRQWLPWTELFRGFRVALGLSKLVLAAAGILVMAILWYALANIFYYQPKDFNEFKAGDPRDAPTEKERTKLQWDDYKRWWDRWKLMYKAAGPVETFPVPVDSPARLHSVADEADSPEQYEEIKAILKEMDDPKNPKDPPQFHEQFVKDAEAKAKKNELKSSSTGEPLTVKDVETCLDKAEKIHKPDAPLKSAGNLRTLPWFEDRGPNPYLMVTGQAGQGMTAEGKPRRLPWEEGTFLTWFGEHQAPHLIEPLWKFLLPVVYFFDPNADWYIRLYLILVLLATLATWAFFGGAITRMAAVEVARNEKISPLEAIRFAGRRYLQFFTAPLLPLLLVLGIVVFLVIFGLFHLIPYVGDVVIDGLLWWLPMILGLVMAGVLVLLVSWPMISATISAEDEEALNATSRAYSYVIQHPWHYLWYALVALAYGAIVVFFVGFMGSLSVYLAKWGVSQPAQTIAPSRDPSFLFAYAPTSFGWRALLLKGVKINHGQDLVNENGQIDQQLYDAWLGRGGLKGAQTPPDALSFNQWFSAVLVSIWLGIFFLFILGFSYSYFWSASTIIYLLMRRAVDDAEIDEVYLEEEDQDDYTLGPPMAPPKAPAPAPPASPAVTMVPAPTLRQTAPPPSPPPAATAPPPAPAAPPKRPEETPIAVSSPPVLPPAPPAATHREEAEERSEAPKPPLRGDGQEERTEEKDDER
jgi:hypothetical protein